jgi:hypothetical protein
MREKEERPILLVKGDRTRDIHEQQWALVKDAITVGRDDTCDLVIPDRQISRQHVRIYRQDEAYFVEDLDSRNGTWVNNQQLKGTRRLYDNDEINLAMAARMQFLGSSATAPLPFEVPANLMDGRLRIDPASRRVFLNDRELDPPLSPPQYRLLELLFIHTGRVCTREQVVDAVWPEANGEGVSEQAIDALVRRLRDRLAEVDSDWEYIVTVRGHGFRLENANQPSAG